jgi:uncharacterized repeat protein (TIGR01451 family)
MFPSLRPVGAVSRRLVTNLVHVRSKWGTGLVMAMLVGSLLPLATAPPASAAVTPASATAIATAIAANPTQITSATFTTVPPTGTPNGVSDAPLSFFPTQGGDFGILTSGNVNLAPTANTSGSSGANLGGGNVRGNTDFDVTILNIGLNAPQGANCLTFNFAFYSEEFPEFVGSGFNDAFIAELDTSTWTTSGSAVTAPNNFAFDPMGNVISINATGPTTMTPANAAGTTYDGATPLLSAATQITPGAHNLYLSIFDQGDQNYDSAVFLDNLVIGFVPNPAQNCLPGAQVVNFQLGLSPASATNLVGTTHTVTATLTDTTGAPVVGAPIAFTVSGANPTTGSGTTNSAGQATFTYTGTVPGSDAIAATYDADSNGVFEASASATKNWQATPAIATTPIPTAAVTGTFLNDSATLTGGFNPTGSVTFSLFDPTNPTCAPGGPAPVYTETVPLSGLTAVTNNTTVAATTAGTWHWTATYPGDLNNAPATSACADEPVIVLAPPTADLLVMKFDSPDPVLNGSPLTYTVTVTNVGPDTATGVVVTDTRVAAGVIFGSAVPSQGGPCTEAAGVVTCPLGTIASGGTATVTITVTPTVPGTIVNIGAVAGNQVDPVAGNNIDIELTTVLPVADLSVAKSDAPDPVANGAPLTYTLDVANAGPDAATGVVVTDFLPVGVDFVSAVASQGGPCTEAAGVVTCPLGTIASGGTATVTITVTPTAPGTILNTAAVTGDQADPVDNNTDAELTTVVAAPPAQGRIVVAKLVDGAGPGIAFPFASDLDGDPDDGVDFALVAGEVFDSGLLDPGVYSVVELVPAGWDLSGVDCSDGSPATAIDLGAGETVTCTFTNELGDDDDPYDTYDDDPGDPGFDFVTPFADAGDPGSAAPTDVAVAGETGSAQPEAAQPAAGGNGVAGADLAGEGTAGAAPAALAELPRTGIGVAGAALAGGAFLVVGALTVVLPRKRRSPIV